MKNLLECWSTLNTTGRQAFLNYANDIIEIERFIISDQHIKDKYSKTCRILKFEKRQK